MTLRAILLGRESAKEIELNRKIDEIGAKTNAKVHSIDRIPHCINHIDHPYPYCPVPLNGETKGIVIRQLTSDNFVQILEVKFGKFAYSPSHTHPHYCVAHVLHGRINDAVRGLDFEEGEWYLVEPGTVHSSQSIDGATMVVYNTNIKSLAEGIKIYQGYDPDQPPFDQLKMTEV